MKKGLSVLDEDEDGDGDGDEDEDEDEDISFDIVVVSKPITSVGNAAP